MIHIDVLPLVPALRRMYLCRVSMTTMIEHLIYREQERAEAKLRQAKERFDTASRRVSEHLAQRNQIRFEYNVIILIC